MKIDLSGEQAVVLSVSYEKTRDCVAVVRRICDYIRAHPHPAILSQRIGLDSVLLEYAGDQSFEGWLSNLQKMDFSAAEPERPDPAHVVPVCYDFGYDMPVIQDRTGMNVDDIIQMHSGRDYHVWMIGFMPGFPYMGELPLELQLERKKNPDPVIPAGSVAIAEEYIGIYPFQSPGGWHVIGRTPMKMINYSSPVPWVLDYGMRIRFQPISKEEFGSYLQPEPRSATHSDRI